MAIDLEAMGIGGKSSIFQVCKLESFQHLVILSNEIFVLPLIIHLVVNGGQSQSCIVTFDLDFALQKEAKKSISH